MTIKKRLEKKRLFFDKTCAFPITENCFRPFVIKKLKEQFHLVKLQNIFQRLIVFENENKNSCSP